MADNLIKELLRQLPESPGVYLMRDARGKIIYVGKSANLRHRVRSYFTDAHKLSPKTRQMVSLVNDFEYFVTASEQEALILELNLVKRHQPHFNVLLKDDKTFPYLKIDSHEEWPRLRITRRLEDDKAHYFGPFASVRSLKQTIKILKGLLPLRSCSKTITGKERRPCLNYHMGHCLSPCTGAVNREEYDDIIRQITLFLEGKHEQVIRQLQSKMDKASKTLDFELAAHLRDQIQALKQVIEGQQIATKVRGEQDAIAFTVANDQACVQVFFIRGSKLIGRESFILQGTDLEEPQQIMTSFVKQFYSSSPYIPSLLLLQYHIEDREVIASWLQNKKGSRVRVEVPQRGIKKQLIDTVAENARHGLEQLKIKQLAEPATLAEALTEIQKTLHLPHLPERIEGYDISNMQGKDAVGSMVVFENGKPKTAHYRRFKIKTVAGANDYAMLQEMLSRRFNKAVTGSNADAQETWSIMPDLVLIDGGKGQLNASLEILQQMGLDSLPVVGLAKENEELFAPRQLEPIILPKSSPGLQLLQRLRDEAHRFAIGYHKKLHKKHTFTSVLDSVPGIGPKRKRALIKQFGSVPAIREASEEELIKLKGITPALVKKLKEYL